MEDIESKIKQAIRKVTKLSEKDIDIEAKLEDVGVDSFAGIDLVYTLEDMFNIKIPDSAMNQMKTVRDVVDAVQSRVKK